MMNQLSALFLVALTAGCSAESRSDDASPNSEAIEPAANATLPETFWSTASTVEALDVFDLRDPLLDGKPVVVRGTVKEFVDGLSAFVLVEDSLLSCDERPGDHCETPWDYCCVEPSELARGSAFVEFREEGRPGEWSIEGFHGISHLSEVVVTGTLAVDDADNLSLVAKSIHLQ